MQRKSFFSLLSLVLTLVCVTGVFAQVTGGRVTGTIADPNGAAVPNATVQLLSAATGHTLTAQTTDAGTYSFPNVAVGDYTLMVESAGFAASTREVQVVLNSESVADLALQVGTVAETVEVSAASAGLVQTESSQQVSNFTARQARDLPVFGNQNALALLSANVVEQSAGTGGTGGTVGGTRPRGNTFNVDGVDNNDPTITGPSSKIIQDTVQEFTLLTNNYNAEFGASAGGQFNTITESGTNGFHGGAFGYLRDESLNAASSLQEQQLRRGELASLPDFSNKRFGGKFGGRIIPNKLFFFGAYQRETKDQAALRPSFLAPTAEGLDRIAALPGASAYVVNLLRNNLTLAPAATRTMTVLGANGIPFGDVVLNVPANFNESLAQVNVDHLPNEMNQIRYRFSLQRTREEQPGGGGARFNNLTAYDTRLFSTTWVRTFGARTVNDLRLSYRRVNENYPVKEQGAGDFPTLDVTALGLSLGPNLVLPQGTPVNNNYQLFDAVNYIRGRHNFKVGGEARRLITSTYFVQFSRGYYDYADFDQLLRDEAPSFNQRGVGSGPFAGNNYRFYSFAQDDWKLNSQFTLNLGLRYELSTLPRDLATQELNSMASVPGVIEFRRPRTDRNNFAPRVGVAYAPHFENRVSRFLFGERNQSALRAHYGISYYEPFTNLTITSLPPQFKQDLNISTAAVAFGFDPRRPFLENGGVPVQLAPISTPAEARAATSSYIPDQTTPRSSAFTVSFQRELTPSFALELRYLNTLGRNLPVQLQLNASTVDPSQLTIPTFLGAPTAEQLSGLPTLAQIRTQPGVNRRALAAYGFTRALTSYQFVGSSRYDAGSVSLTRRYTRGFAATAAYTWSKTIDNATNELNTSTPNPRRPQDFFNLNEERSVSALDIPHRFAGSFSYEFQFLNERRDWVRTVFGGIELNGIFQAQSGQPVTVISGRDANLNFDSVGDRTIINLNGIAGTSSLVRPVNAAGQTVSFNNNATVAYVAVNPSAQYIQAGQGALANAGRNTLRTRGFNRTDTTLIKNFRFNERFNMQAGVEAFNLFNQRLRTLAGLGAQNGTAAGAFATAGNANFNNYSAGNYEGRSVQLRAKFIF